MNNYDVSKPDDRLEAVPELVDLLNKFNKNAIRLDTLLFEAYTIGLKNRKSPRLIRRKQWELDSRREQIRATALAMQQSPVYLALIKTLPNKQAYTPCLLGLAVEFEDHLLDLIK